MNAQPTEATRAEQALAVARLGLRIFPATADKKPYEEGWQMNATTDPEKVRAWWTKYPDAAIGLPIPDGTVAVDIDYPTLFDGSGLDLPATATQSTPRGGSHHFYRIDREVPQTVGAYHPSLDTRVPGKGYVVVYEPDRLSPPSTWTAAPAWLYETPTYKASGGNGQHAYLVSLAGTLHNARKTPDEIRDILWPIAQAWPQLDPAWPWRKNDIDKIVDSLATWDTRDDAAVVKPIGRTLAELMSADFPEQAWRIEGLLQASGVGVLIAAEKTGKSLSFMQMALSIAAGVDFLGFKCEPCPVLLIEEEGAEVFMQARARKQLKGLGLPQDLPVTTYHAQNFRFDDQRSLALLRDEIIRTGAKVVLAGPMSQLASLKDTYKPEEWNRIGRLLKPLVKELGVMFLVAHHRRKTVTQPKTVSEFFDTFLGSVALNGIVDVSLGILRDSEEAEGVFFARSRDFEAQRFGLRMDTEALLFTRDDSVMQSKKLKNAGNVAAWLMKNDVWAKLSVIAEGCDTSESTTQRTLDQLIASGDVTFRIGEGRGKPKEYKLATTASLETLSKAF